MEIKINDNLFNVIPLITSKDIEKGMMNKKFDSSFDGMLFMIKDGNYNFWMKNCIIPLDIIFIKKNKIAKIHHNCKPCRTNDCKFYDGYGDMVLELSGGSCLKYQIKDGDSIEIL